MTIAGLDVTTRNENTPVQGTGVSDQAQRWRPHQAGTDREAGAGTRIR